MPQQQTFPTVVCVGCDRPMVAVVIDSGRNVLRHVLYRCEECRIETKRTIEACVGPRR